MGYEFHITRKPQWADDEGAAIAAQEWLAVAARFDLRPVSKADMAEEGLELPEEWHAHRWHGHPEAPGGGPVFRLSRGNINFVDFDTATMHFALALAAALGARVAGDEDEEYGMDHVLGPSTEEGWSALNPFTQKPAYQTLAGRLERDGDEWHLVTRKRTLFSREERALLYFVVPAPSEAAGGAVRVRGRLSDAGVFGRNGACEHVFYVLRVSPSAQGS